MVRAKSLPLACQRLQGAALTGREGYSLPRSPIPAAKPQGQRVLRRGQAQNRQ